MEERKIQVVCLDDMAAYYDVTDASWDKQLFISSILDCCNGKTKETYNTCWEGKERKILNTHWKYYDDSIEGDVVWVDCYSSKDNVNG